MKFGIPQRGFHGAQHGDEHAGLRPREDASLANLLEQPMDVEWALAANALTEALDEMVGPLDGVDGFAAPQMPWLVCIFTYRLPRT